MAWFRTNRGVAAWLALFALACQLSFSFGHLHIHNGSLGAGKLGAGKFGISTFSTGTFSTRLTAAATPHTTDASTGAPPAAPPNDPAAPAADFCAICANISLAAALILPVLAILLAPVLLTEALLWPPTVREIISFGRQPFNARGPPHA